MEIIINNIQEIRKAAQAFIQTIGQHRVFAFYGKMGVGKTTLIKAICEELGVEDVITSPTFAIVNEYEITNHKSQISNLKPPLDLWSLATGGTQETSNIFHFDFYRIKRIEEVYDMGYEEYFYSGSLCFIEWPELIEDLLPDDAVRVSITENPDGTRTVNVGG